MKFTTDDLSACPKRLDHDILELESELDSQLRHQWGTQAKCVVISPEVDIWLWAAENALRTALQWPLADIGIREWLRERGFEFDSSEKPRRPKEALEALLSVHRLPRSSALYEKITAQISLQYR